MMETNTLGSISMSAKPETKDLLKIIRDLHHVHDYAVLLERVLHEARIFVRADAGTLYLRDGDRLYFNYIENDTLFPDGKSEDKFAYTDRSILMDKSSLAGFVAVTGQPLLIDDVYALPESLNFTFNPEFDKQTNYHTQSQLVIPLIGNDQKSLGVIQLINAQHGGKTVPFSAMDKVHISFLSDHAVLALEKAEMAREMVMRMVAIAELRDPFETGSHARRVGEIALVLYDRFAASRGVNLAERNQKKEAFRAAAILHDVGKAGVPGDILAKDGQYNEKEKLLMYRHTVYGARLFPNSESLWDRIAKEVILNHHERWDGSGYPGKVKDVNADPIKFSKGKKGKEIPLSARIVAIADVYDALTSERSYKEAWNPESALRFLKSKSGKLFDPELVGIFLDMSETLDAIRRNFNE
jgi:HD-GYP domain-containing protein (c-di-GMP phosphodiesterase class II)